jgi:hypothetical protein
LTRSVEEVGFGRRENALAHGTAAGRVIFHMEEIIIMTRHCWTVAVLLAGLAGLFVASKAEAGLIPTNVSVTPDGSNFRWTYAVVVTTDVKVNPGDFFTIYDFGGLVPGPSTVATPVGWSYTTSMVGPTPAGTSPADDPTLPNLTFTYSGTAPINGQMGLGNFMVDSTFGNATTSDFTSITHRQVDGVSEANITSTNVPVPGAVHQTPEPATLAMFSIGLPMLGVLRFLRNRRKK